MSNVKEGLRYTEDHEWIALDGETATLGITDFAQSSLGDIVFVELPGEGEELEEGSSFGVVESIKSVSDLYSPVNGVVLDKNTAVEDAPDSINQDAFESWLLKIKVTDTAAVEALMDAAAYTQFCADNA